MIEAMFRNSRSARSADALFVAAVILLVAGSWLLPVTAGGAERPSRLWPLLLVGAGAIWVYLAISRRYISSALFGGTFLGLSGILLVVAELAQWSIGMIWPLFMVLVGLSLLAMGARRTRKPLSAYLIPALSFMAIGAFFALFSFRATGMPFRAFVKAYWPLVFVASAAALFAAYGLGRVRPRLNSRRHGREGKA